MRIWRVTSYQGAGSKAQTFSRDLQKCKSLAARAAWQDSPGTASSMKRSHRVKQGRKQQSDTGCQAEHRAQRGAWSQKQSRKKAIPGAKCRPRGWNGKRRKGAAQAAVNVELRWIGYSR